MTTALRSEPFAVQLDAVQLCHPQVAGSAHRRLPSALSHPVATVVGTSAALVALPGRIIDPVTGSRPRCAARLTPPRHMISMLWCTSSGGYRSSPTRWIAR